MIIFNNRQARYDFLDNAKSVEADVWQSHVSSFIKSFVVKEKRHRWHHLCIDKPEKAHRDSHKIYTDLMWNLSSPADYQVECSLIKRNVKGVFYDFSGAAWWLSAEEALRVGHGYESIFSIQEGASAIYFWHEMEHFLFKK